MRKFKNDLNYRKTISLYIYSEKTYNKIENIAIKEKRSISTIVNSIVEDFFEKKGKEKKNEK
jgi:hypothetical protein